MKTRKLTGPRFLVVAFAAAAALALAACGGGNGGYGGGSSATTPSSPAAGDGVTTDRISIENFSFTPATATISAGTTVTWINNDSTAHDVTSTDGPGVDAATTSTFASGRLAQGDTFSFTFDEPGTYDYECTIHATMATMHAVIIVQ